jgi:hypothetical protein
MLCLGPTNTARELLDMAKAKDTELHVLWSGGIDTTAAVAAFLRVTEESRGERQRLIIRYCPRSVGEYPAFWEEVIRTSFPRHEVIMGHVRDVFDGTRLVVTGDPNDMLWGTFVMANAFKVCPLFSASFSASD